MSRKVFLLLGVVAVLAVIINCQATQKPTSSPDKPDPWLIKQLPLNQATAYLIRSIVEGMTTKGIESVTVTDLLDLEDSPTVLGRQLAEDFITNLIRSGRFEKVVERRRLETVLQEQEIQISALVDPVTATRIGQLCGVDGLVIGTLNEGPRYVRVNIRLIATETGQAFSSANVEITKDEQVAEWMRRVASDKDGRRFQGGEGPGPRDSHQESPHLTPAMSEDGTKYFAYFNVPDDWRGSSRLVRFVNNATFYNKVWLEHKPVVFVKGGADLDFIPGEENAETTTMFVPPGITAWCLAERTGDFDCAVTEGYDIVPQYPSLGKRRTYGFVIGPGSSNTVILGGL